MTSPNQVKPKKKGPYKKAEYDEYIRFTALPRVLRDKEFGFHSDDAFIKHHKLSSYTLYEWRKDVDFWRQVNLLLNRWAKDKTPDVIWSLYRTAVQKGGAAEVMAWMKIVEDWREKTEVNMHEKLEALKSIQDNTRKLVENERKKLTHTI